nr:uncharacterized protein LOC109157277 [Ipomoea batatas]GME02883.1 uncharacterized protein LOC109157277 [Ipomoea batatas]
MKLKKDNGAWAIIDFKYERLPTFCFHCGIIGHGERFCHLSGRRDVPVAEKPYGSWLRAGARRIAPSAGQRWVAPASNMEKQNCKALASERDTMRIEVRRESSTPNQADKGKDVMQENAKESDPMENPVTVLVEQKKRRMGDEDATLRANAQSITAPYSDHLPLQLTPVIAAPVSRCRRFCFDNMWLREETCTEIVSQSWSRTVGLDVLARIEACSRDIWSWGRKYNKDFLRKIDACKSKLEHLRPRTDTEGCREYKKTEKELLILLEQQHVYWKQRAKEHWWKGGDLNTKYFHNSVKARRRRNQIRRLKNDQGAWVETENEIGGIMVEYF